MLEKIGHKGVSTVSETGCDVRIAVKQSNAARFEDRLVFENDGFCGSIFGKIAGVFSWFKNTAVSIFRIVFCCDCSASIFGASVLSKPAEAKKLFSELHDFFVTQREADTSIPDRPTFAAEWKEKFNSLPDEVQARIMKEDMRDWAIDKDLKGDDINGFIESSYAIPAERTKSLEFVRDLKTVKGAKGIYNPMTDKEVPMLLTRIRDDYDRQVQAAEKAKNS